MQVLQTAEVKPTEAAVPQGRPPVVLLADDDPTTLRMLSGMLQQEGIATLTAGSLTGLCPQYEARRYLRSVFYQLKGEAERFKHAA